MHSLCTSRDESRTFSQERTTCRQGRRTEHASPGHRWPKHGYRSGLTSRLGGAGSVPADSIERSSRRPPGPPPARTRGALMFERFTDRARRVVVLAQEEARMLTHNPTGTEHILRGLIHEGEGVAAKALESLGISLEAVREQVQEIIGQGQQAPSGHI